MSIQSKHAGRSFLPFLRSHRLFVGYGMRFAVHNNVSSSNHLTLKDAHTKGITEASA